MIRNAYASGRVSAMVLLNALCFFLRDVEHAFKGGRTYDTPDLLGVLYYIHRDGRIGRIMLSRRLRLGEQSVRSILNFLSKKNYVFVKDGLKKVESNLSMSLNGINVSFPFIHGLLIGWNRIVLFEACLPSVDFILNHLVELRDSVVRWGGKGAVIIVAKKTGKPYLPGLGEGEVEKNIVSFIQKTSILDCSGVKAIIGLEENIVEWYPIYGFLNVLCRLYYSF